MRTVVYLIIGIFFGIVMYKSEAASWFRIFEMFQFASFHMYGIFASALAVGITGIQLIKKKGITGWDGKPLELSIKPLRLKSHLAGGFIFGLGWALAGVCPGPIYVLVGAGYLSVLIVLAAAVAGALTYGLLKDKLPH